MRGHYPRITNKKLRRASMKSYWRGDQRKILFGRPHKPKDIEDYEAFMREKDFRNNP